MDPEYSLQDLVRCHICETPGPSLHCDICYNICVDIVRKNISQRNSKNTKWCHLICEDLPLNAKNIPQKYVKDIVNNARFLFVYFVSFLKCIEGMNLLTWSKNFNHKNMYYKEIYKN